MEKRGVVIFDFDGVIADSFTQAYETAKEFCVHKTEDSYRKQYEGNIWEYEHQMDGLDHSVCNHTMDWFSAFVPRFEKESSLFPGMDAVVKHLAEHHTLVIVSSSIGHAIEHFLKKHHLREYFEDILDSNVNTSKAVKIGMVFEKYRVLPVQCIMITDSRGDIVEAASRGVDSIAVTWGYNKRAALVPGNPWRIIELPLELPNAVTEFFHGKGTAA